MKQFIFITAILLGQALSGHGAFVNGIPENPTFLSANTRILEDADRDFFRHDWVKALEGYNRASIKGLGPGYRSLYSYRMALCLIKTGHYSEARQWLADMKGSRFQNARTFYSAYLDYIAGDYKKAAAGFNDVRKGIPGLDAEYYLLQIDYIEGNYRKVADKAPALALHAPASIAAELTRIAGMSYFHLGDYIRAEKYFLEYMKDDHGGIPPETEYALGAIFYDKGEYEKAENRLTPVTTVTGPLAQGAWLYIGQCRAAQGDLKGATLAFEKGAAYETDPAVAETSLFNYVTALTKGGSVPFSRSTKMLDTFVKRWPDSSHAEDVEQYLTQAYYNDHDYTGAVACVDAFPHPGPKLLDIKQKSLFQQGVREAANGQWRQSASWFAKAADMTACDKELAAQARLWLADANYATGSYKEAVRNYDLFLKNAPRGENRTLGLYNLAYAQYKLGRYRDAASTFAKALAGQPTLRKPLADDAAIRRADCLYYIGNYTEASEIFGEAASGGGADADYASYRRALTLGLSAGSAAKIKALDDFIARYPDSKWMSAALLEKALTHEELGETKQASETYRKRLALTSDVGLDELLTMAGTTDQSGDAPAEQLNILERIRRAGNLSADETADIDLYEANARALLGEDETADAIYQRLAGQPESLSGSIAAVTLADRYNARADFNKAFDLMNSFTEQGSPHLYWLARGFIALADACSGLGRPELAREYLLSLQENYPGEEPDIISAIDSRLKKLKKA